MRIHSKGSAFQPYPRSEMQEINIIPSTNFFPLPVYRPLDHYHYKTQPAHVDYFGTSVSIKLRNQEASIKPNQIHQGKNFSDLSDFDNKSTSVSSSSTPVLPEQIRNDSDFQSNNDDDGFSISNYKLEHEDLNECVSALVKKVKDDPSSSKDVKRRQRKSKEQLRMLEHKYEINPNWTREYIKELSRQMGLRECQVYKWHWDQRKKDGLEVGSPLM